MIHKNITCQISVVMPVHNAESYLSEVIKSILQQTYPDFELIVINDNSDDNTLNLINDFAREDQRIKVICNENNLGAGASRNCGLEIAKGKYVLFLDDDDVVDISMFECLYTKAESLELDVLCYRSNFKNYNSREITETPWTIRKDLLPTEEVFSGSQIKQDFFRAFIWWPWDKFFRRNFIISTNVRFQEIRTSNDLAFTATQVLLAERISVLDKVLISHTVSRSGSLENSRNISYECAIEALIKLKENLEIFNIFHNRRSDYINYCVFFIQWNVNTLNGEAYFSFYKLSKDFLISLNIIDSELYDKELLQSYHDLIELSPVDYLFKLNFILQNDLNKANSALQELDILRSAINESVLFNKELIDEIKMHKAFEELNFCLANYITHIRRVSANVINDSIYNSLVERSFNNGGDFETSLKENLSLFPSLNVASLQHIKLEFENILKVLSLYRERNQELENKK